VGTVVMPVGGAASHYGAGAGARHILWLMWGRAISSVCHRQAADLVFCPMSSAVLLVTVSLALLLNILQQ
jgi:hypothetical protein